MADPNRVARLYAYWALRTLDPTIAQRHRASVASDTTQVETMRGCISTNEQTREVAAAIDRLEWSALHKPEIGAGR